MCFFSVSAIVFIEEVDYLRAFLVALQFLTRIQLVRQDDLTIEDFGHATKYFPLVGVVLGGLYLAVVWLCQFFSPWPHLSLVLWLLLPLMLTGGLHYDGFMDTVDGLFSGRERERILEIMKDSRVGSFGALAMMSLLLLNLAVLTDLPPGMVMAAMFVMPVIGRMAMVLVIFAFPYARPEGMGKVFAEMADRKTLLLSLLTTLIFVLPWGKMACLALAGGLVWGWLVAYYAYRKLGGLTGDVYGATELLTETAVLCLFLFSPLIPGGSELFWK